MNKQNFKYAVSVYGLTIFALVMCFIVYISISAISTGLGTHVSGYTTYEVLDNSEYKEVSTHEFADGEDQTIPEATENHKNVSNRSELSKGAVIFENVLLQVFMAAIFIILIYNKIGAIGKRDGDDFRFNGKPYDKNRGLKIGLIAAVPSVIMYLALVVSKLVSYNVFFIYKIVNITFRPIIDLFCGNVTDINEVSLPAILSMIIIVAILPAVCVATYKIGFNDEAITKKLVYKKK